MQEHRHLLDAVEAIDPTRVSYEEWVEVGMALHESGFACDDWDAWSARDASRYHEGECARKWAGFGSGMGDHVTSGSIIEMAERAGWVQPSGDTGSAIGWDDDVTIGPDPSWVESAPIEPTGKSPTAQLYEYVSALFDDEDFVGYCVKSRADKDQSRFVPANRGHARKAGELRAELAKADELGAVVGDWSEDAGAWIRFNPLDGKGVGNANVTEYRYALVESDALDVERQRPMIEAMNLPCAAIVSSAGKSVHAIVRIDAGRDYDLYRKRVDALYRYCRAHGFEPDTQNKNPSRLSRMPGVTRHGKVQELLATNVGAESWEAWEDWVKESEDNLPDEEVGNWDAPIVLKPDLIGQGPNECILRRGAKMIVVGDSKMGKSYTLIDLALAICVGGTWLGMSCAEGMVFYVNLEIDASEFRWRQHEVWRRRPECGVAEAEAKVNANFVTWQLRGYAANMRDMIDKLTRRVLKYGPPGTFAAIVIDPIYKVNGGDDNDARAVAEFTNLLDRIIARCGCAVIYAHHHPKGATGARKSIDRMSGSGVYGRDADTVLDFSPLYADTEAREKWKGVPLFRASVDCRSFGHRKPIDAAFRWPRFYRDPDGSLARLKVVGEDPRAEGADRGKSGKARRDAEARQVKIDAVRKALAQCETEGIAKTVANAYDRFFYESEKKPGQNVMLKTFTEWVGGKLGPFSTMSDGSQTIIIDDRTSINI